MSTYKKKFFLHNSDKKWPLPDQVSALVFREVQNGRTGRTFKLETRTKIEQFFKNIYHTQVKHVGIFGYVVNFFFYKQCSMKFSRKKMIFLLICLQVFKKLVFSKSPTWFTSV